MEEVSRKVRKKRWRWFGRVMSGKKTGFGSTGDEEEKQARATTGGHNRGHERERHTTRADAGPSCAEATRQMR